MSGILAWISGKLFSGRHAPPDTVSRKTPAPVPDSGTRGDTKDQGPLEKLEDHLYCWLLDTGPRQLNEPSDLTARVVREIESRLENNALEELPRQPLTLPTLMRTLGNESTTRKEVAGIILSDSALTNQVLSVANSPFFKVGDQPVETVEQAVFLLGLDGIRNVASASVMRPMLAARNSSEALFTQRVWRWGLTCSRASELIALTRHEESTSYFMVGLLPALSYLILRREVQRIFKRKFPDRTPSAHTYHEVMRTFQWQTARKVARAWHLPARYHALLLKNPGYPDPDAANSPLRDGIILGTREALRDAHQRNLGDDELRALLSLEPKQLEKVRHILVRLLSEGLGSR
ncbi:HDOD domain-containing protein [Marinobacter daqiaonensis]|uniref:HDOD domain-containing protein n=1 Tax=Marinobacter daqiaonensis TaxID=650891 RepID=A0A1I6HN85_9GAMM|nr:HDOD domain-containing protein [Marinobacter daqiaonensis]SFR55848.1 HDOD domain-containing protein [Marinobacter daqiaonensis]